MAAYVRSSNWLSGSRCGVPGTVNPKLSDDGNASLLFADVALSRIRLKEIAAGQVDDRCVVAPMKSVTERTTSPADVFRCAERSKSAQTILSFRLSQTCLTSATGAAI